MKKFLVFILSICFIIIFTRFTYCQTSVFGFSVGGNISYHSISGGLSNNTQSKRGYTLGVFGDFKIGNFLRISSELNYAQKGSKIQITNNNQIIEIPTYLYYLSAPMIVKLGLDVHKEFYIFTEAGIRVDALLDKDENELNGIYRDRNNITYGGTIGLGLSYLGISDRMLGIEIRYNPDISKFNVSNYNYKGTNFSYPLNTEFRNETVEAIIKIGFR